MEFQEIILDQIAPILLAYGFTVVEHYKNYVKFESASLVIITGYDDIEKVTSLFIGRLGGQAILIDGNIMEQFFSNDLLNFIIPQRTQQDFAHNLAVLFKGSGKELLEGNLSTLIEIEDYAHAKAKSYTEQLITSQNLKIADNAWKINDYTGFLKAIEQIDIKSLPSSYQLKKKIAIQKKQP